MNTYFQKNRSRLLASTIVASLCGAAPVALATLVAGAPSAALAQDYTSGNLSGAVVADGGKPVAGATVAISSNQGVKRTATTNAAGQFIIPALPFGNYQVHVTAPGLAATDGSATVSPNGGSYTFTLSANSVSEVVVTAVRQKSADFNRTDTGITIDVPELSSRVPIGRNITSVALLTPGAVAADPSIVAVGVRREGQSALAISGTSAAESAYYINGLNVTDQRTFLGFADLPFDAIQSVDVKTGGYSAEFGRATGGVINIVTRSGSNEFHGGGSIFYTPRSLGGKSPDSYSAVNGAGNVVYNRFASTDLIDSDVYLSGPILKDRLFFFGILNERQQKRSSAVAADGMPGTPDGNTGTQTFFKVTTPRWLGKLDFNLTDSQRLEATVFSDATKTQRTSCRFVLGTGCTSKGLEIDNKTGGVNQIYKYTGVWTNWFTLSALYGQVRSQYTDEGAATATPYVTDQTSGVTKFLTATLNPGPWATSDVDVRDTYRVDGDFYFNLLGAHHLRVGVDDEKLTSTDLSAYSGGAYYQARNTNAFHIPGSTYSGDYVRVTTLQQGGSFTADQSAFYAEDSWEPVSGLTLQLGLRNDRYVYKTSAGAAFADIKNQYAPRLGFTYDVFHDGNDKLYGSFGRYYLPIAENTAIREAAAAPFFRDYYAITKDASGNVVLGPGGIPVLGAKVRPTQVLSSGDAPDPRTIASANLKPMYTQEFVLGYEHRFTDGWLDHWKAGLRYIDRNLAETIEDTNLQNTAGSATSYGDGVVGRYCQRVGISAAHCNTRGYVGTFTIINPGFAQRVFLDPDGAGARYVDLTTSDFGLPKATNHYRALEFTFERPFDGTWGLQGSYVLSAARGNYEGAVKSDIGQADTSITQDFDTPYYEVGATGYLPNDRRHTFKIFGSYSPMENLLIGANFTAQSGRHFGCLGYSPDDPNPSAVPSEWYCADSHGVDQPTPRGSKFVTGWVTNLDLNLSYRLSRPDDFGAAVVSVEVFNVLGAKSVTKIQEQGDVSGVPGQPTVTYGLPRNYQAPRSVRFGVRYSF